VSQYEDDAGGRFLIEVGRILAPVGVRGEVRVWVLSDVPHRFAAGSLLWIDGSCLRVQRSRGTSRGAVVKFCDVDSRFDADSLRDKLLFVDETDVPLPPLGTYYHYQLLGMQVRSQEGRDLGTLTEVIATGANDVYVVNGDGGEVLIPAIIDFVLSVDLKHNTMTVNVPQVL
jgi:16S rRNA processing protein RimM